MRPPYINEKGKNDHKDARQELISQHIVPDYDIVCFQELFTALNHRRPKVINSARDSGLSYTSLPPKPPLLSIQKVNSGLLTLSRFNITKTIFKPYKNFSGVDSIAHKGVLYSKIEISDQVLHLFNTHLQASYGCVSSRDSKGKYSQKKHYESRLKQMIELRNFVSEVLKNNSRYDTDSEKLGGIPFEDTILITGDFNTKSSRNLPKNLFESSFSDPRASQWIESQPEEKFIEYEFLVHVLSNFGQDKVVDYLKDSYDGNHPTTAVGGIGNGNKPAPTEEEIHNCIHSGDAGIDYWFEIKPFGDSCAKLEGREDEGKKCEVRPFFVEHPDFDSLSDHYGVELNLAMKYYN